MDDAGLVRRMYQTWNDDDVASAVSFMHPEIEWRTSGLFPGLEPVYRGPEGVLQFERDLRTPFSTFEITVERIRPEGEAIVATVRFDAVGAESGVAVQLRYENIWHVREGLIVRFDSRPLE